MSLRHRARGWLVRLAGVSVSLELPGVRLAWSGPRVDPLTGLPDRRALEVSLEAACRRGAALLFVDLDRFKRVNDARGHAAGDAVLVEVGARLRAWRRPGEQVGRWGGDEFLAVLPGADLEHARSRADDLLVRMRAPVPFERRPLEVTASAGLAAIATGGAVDALLHDADRALYAAKARGGDRAAHAPPRLVRVLPVLD